MPERPTYEELERRIRELETSEGEMAHRKNQSVLNETEEIFRHFMENSPIYVFFKDKDIRSVRLSRNYEQMLGRPLDELLGKTMDELFPSELAKKMIADDQNILKEGKLVSIDEEFNGRYYTTIKFPIFIDGQARYLSGYTMDITEQKQAEEKLKKSERRFRELAEMLPETIFEIDLQGKLTFVNRKAFEMFGYMPEDVEKGINVFDLVHEKDKPRVLQNVGKIINGENLGVTEYEISRKDGSFFPGLFHSSVILHDHKPVGLRGFLIDITEKKRTQEILIQNEKIMSIGGLAAGMAHEINNPLAGMIQNAQVVMNRLSTELPANEKAAEASGTTMSAIKSYMEKREILQLLRYINDAGRQAAGIVQNMLSFAGMQAPGKTPRDMPQLIEKTLDLIKSGYNLQKGYDFKEITIIKEFDPDLPRVMCEENKIQQVILNIIKNSVDAAAQSQMKSKDIVIGFRLKHERGRVRMEIEDNGPGMDLQTRKRIFEPFFTTKGVDKGTGLGLSISYFIIVDDHKGEMEVESSPGKGTKFIIKFPA